jgi:putative inorganic carbon (HCO3(-)) transporter
MSSSVILGAAPATVGEERASAAPWSTAVFWSVALGSTVVPCLFTTRLDDVFVVPKLAALWLILAACVAVLAASALATGWTALAVDRLLSVDVAIAFLLLFNVTAFALSGDKHQSLFGERFQYQGLLAVLLYVGFFALARITVTDDGKLAVLFGAVTIGGTLVATYALLQQARLDPVWTDGPPGGRVFSSIGLSTALAAYLVLTIPIAIACVCRVRHATARAVTSVSVAMLLSTLVYAYSRAGYLAMLVAAPFVVIAVARFWNLSARRIVGAFAAGAAAIVLIAAVAVPIRRAVDDAWARAVSTTDLATPTKRACLICPGQGDISIRMHLDFWNVATQMALDHPAFGTGQERFPDLFPQYSHAMLLSDRVKQLDQFRVESPHNVYLAVAAGVGFPGLIAYLVLLFMASWIVVKGARAATDPWTRVALWCVLAAVVGHLITDAFMTAELTSSWLFWTLLGAGLATAARTLRAARSEA